MLIKLEDIHRQIEYATKVMAQWPEWKRNILTHSLQPTNSSARNPVENNDAYKNRSY